MPAKPKIYTLCPSWTKFVDFCFRAIGIYWSFPGSSFHLQAFALPYFKDLDGSDEVDVSHFQALICASHLLLFKEVGG